MYFSMQFFSGANPSPPSVAFSMIFIQNPLSMSLIQNSFWVAFYTVLIQIPYLCHPHLIPITETPEETLLGMIEFGTFWGLAYNWEVEKSLDFRMFGLKPGNPCR